ncbi:MAG TPA: response regulator transcription factor [Coleofasciculaceae cyanobacterium]
MPGIEGVEACRQIKQLHPKIPVLVLTSHFKKQLIEQLIAVGASGYCLKAIEAKTLILALRSCCGCFLVRCSNNRRNSDSV